MSSTTAMAAGDPPSRPTDWRRSARGALGLLIGINLFNYIDRQVLAAMEPELRRHFGLKDDMVWMGLLSTAFLLSYMMFAPVFGVLAERFSRWKLVGVGVIVWSLASGASGLNWGLGLAGAYWMLFATRCFVGVGEGGYGPIAPTMIADLYPVAERGKVMSWFYLAMPVGGALGYAFGELMVKKIGPRFLADPQESWRWAFYLVVPPGLLLGLACFWKKDPPRGQHDVGMVANHQTPMQQYLGLLRIRSYVFNTLGMTAMTFAIGGLAFWMPAYLDFCEDAFKASQDSGFDPRLAGIGPRTVFGGFTALAGLFATLLGGIVGDALRTRWSGSYFVVSGIAMLAGVPALLLFLTMPFPMAWIFGFLAVFCLFFNTGPTNTILANVTHPSVRAAGFAFNIFVIHLLGDAISPPILGWISNNLGGGGLEGMRLAFRIVAATTAVGGVLWLMGAKHLEEDTRLAPTRVH
ncbi:MAG: MFS transporter [Gemmataceae bacterium]|nr:MFS transporter [Gemmataceae bacterium]